MLIAAADTSISPLVIMGPLVVVVGIIMIAVLITVSIRGRVARRQAAAPPPREMIQQIKDRASSRAATTSSTSEMVDTARRLAAQLDNKAARLEQLIAEADQRLQRLQRLEQQHVSDTPPPPPPPAPDPYALPTEPEPDPLTRSVYDLADNGHEPVEIARQLDEQIGKVELILALRGH
ncbi:MAG: hypothetical protein ACYTGG_06145 [Planctomycetota bacterium]